jgi:hypothetical protein
MLNQSIMLPFKICVFVTLSFFVDSSSRVDGQTIPQNRNVGNVRNVIDLQLNWSPMLPTSSEELQNCGD